MNKNKIADTAKKGQTAKKKEQPEKVVKALAEIKARRENKQLNVDDIKKKTNVPTGKTISLAERNARKKAHEEAYKNFRIAALRRRCKRMKVSEEETEKLVKELKKILEEPATYTILVMFNKDNADIIKQSLMNEKIDYKLFCDTYTYIDGDTSVLGKVRSIMPEGTKIYPRVKKKPTVSPKAKDKKPTNNTANKKTATKAAHKAIKMMRFTSRPKRKGKAAAMQKKRTTLLKKRQERLKKMKANVAKMNDKKPSEGLKKAA